MIDLHPQGARHAVIWLHGLGDSGAGLASLVDALDLPAELPVRHLLPDAPSAPSPSTWASRCAAGTT